MGIGGQLSILCLLLRLDSECDFLSPFRYRTHCSFPFVIFCFDFLFKCASAFASDSFKS